MKKTCIAALFVLAFSLPAFRVNAQQFSNWSADPKVRTLKTRYLTYKTSENWNEIRLEVLSSEGCTLLMTSSLCNNDPLGKNGWQPLRLRNGEVKTLYFKAHRSCMNGWWWWYKNYKTTSVRID